MCVCGGGGGGGGGGEQRREEERGADEEEDLSFLLQIQLIKDLDGSVHL